MVYVCECVCVQTSSWRNKCDNMGQNERPKMGNKPHGVVLLISKPFRYGCLYEISVELALFQLIVSVRLVDILVDTLLYCRCNVCAVDTTTRPFVQLNRFQCRIIHLRSPKIYEQKNSFGAK